MKKLMNICFVVSSLFAAGLASAVEVAGNFVYKMPAGELVVRDAVLDVPPRGQGSVVLKYAGTSVSSDKFRTRESHGRTIFEVLFMNPPGPPANTAVVLTGSYIRGTNAVIYYGDVYFKTVSESEQAGLDFENADFLGDHGGWSHAAGFQFNTLVK